MIFQNGFEFYGPDFKAEYNLQKMNGTKLTEKDKKRVLKECPSGTIERNVLTFWPGNKIEENQILENIGQGGYRLTDIN